MPAGPEPFDAYRALQLMPTAPHDLVEQAYWVLVTRTRARGSNSTSLGRLNDAYATLINPDRRELYDAEHNLAKLRARPKLEMPKRPMFGRKPRFKTRLTHYQLLDIDFEAFPEVVDTAYVFHKAQIRRSDPRAVFLRSLVEDAYATLSNPQSRAAYDEKIAPRFRKLVAAPAPVAEPEPPPPTPLFAEEVAPESLLAEEAAQELAEAVTPEDVLAEPVVVEPAPEPVVEEPPEAVSEPVTEEPVATEPVPEHLIDERLDDTPAWEPAPEPLDDEPAPVTHVSEAPLRVPAPARPPAEPGRFWRWLRSIFARREGASEQRDRKLGRDARGDLQRAVVAAEQKRVSDLGLFADPLPAQAPRPVMGRARFRFIDGPQAGQTIGLTEHSLILGASEAADVMLENPDGMIGAGHVRVWRRDDEYILHQLDSFSTTYVNGERLDLRLAILERGDEIRIGPHTLMFDEVAVDEAEPTPVEA